MKKILGLFAVLPLVFIMCACGNVQHPSVSLDERNRTEATDSSSWSVFIYACGESQKLNSALTELCTVNYPSNINIVVQTGGNDEAYLQRFVAQKKSLFLKDQEPLTSMGDYETLTNYLTWGTQTFPADKYMVLFLGDSTGTELFKDKNFADDSLTVEELSYAVSLAGQSFDIMAFDGAYTASLEVASSLSPYAKYMVASEEKCIGFDYKHLSDCLIEYPYVSAEELCRIICDDYYEKCSENNYETMAALSVSDLSHMSTLVQAFDGMADVMVDTLDSLDSYGELSRNILTSQYCIGSDDMIDLASMAASIIPNVGEPAQEVINALPNTVIYNVKGELRPMSNGLCVYYPQDINHEKLNTYMKSTASDNYKQFIKSISPNVNIADQFVTGDYEQTWAWCDYVGREFEGSSYIDESSKYALQINGEINILKDVRLKKYLFYPDSNAYYSLGSDSNLSCDWAAQRYTDNSAYTTPHINGEPVQINLQDELPDVGKFYTIPILLNDNIAEITAHYSWDKQKFRILGIWQNGAFIKVKSGDRITPLHSVKDDDETILTGKTVKCGFGLKLKNKSMPSGDYVLQYELEDIYSKIRFPASAKLSKRNRTVTISQ